MRLVSGFRYLIVCGTASAALFCAASLAQAMSMKEAVATAVDSNPEIGEAVANRAAIEFELEQGRGLYRPRLDLEGSIGGEIRDSVTSRANNDEDHLFLRKEASVVVRQLLFDGFGTEAEIERQASRVDGAALRVRERSEFIALAVIREYLEMLRTRRIISLAKENIGYHQKILGEISEGAGGGTISVADRQQAQERIYAARSRMAEFQEEYKAAEAAFIRLVGRPPGALSAPINARSLIPGSLNAAIEQAHANHPSIKFAQADIDAAAALVKAAQSKYYPNLSLEGRASAGEDVGGVRGFDGDLQGNLVMRWNLYNGGIDAANEQEQIRHVDEEYHKLHRITREVDEGVRLSWSRYTQQTVRLRELLREMSAIQQLRGSYFEQFRIGERSLLDLLDTQNTRFSVQVAIATSDAAVKFGHFRILAATGSLLRTIGIAAPAESRTYAREEANVPETPSPDSFDRVELPPPAE